MLKSNSLVVVLLRIAALLLACLLSYSIIHFYKSKTQSPNSVAIEIDTTSHKKIYGNFNQGTHVVQELFNALNTGNKIVLMGSSELGQPNLKSIPYNFFNDSLHQPLIAFGHAGHQTFAIFCELAAMNHTLEKSKVVIIISPSWFLGESGNGLSLSSFFEFVTPQMQNTLYNDKNIPNEFKDYIAKYVTHHFTEIDEPTALLTLWHLRYLKKKTLLNKWRNIPLEFIESLKFNIEYVTKDYQWPKSNTDTSISNANRTIINWEPLMKEGISAEASRCSNQFSVYDEYYNQYCKGKLPRKANDVASPNIEMNDLQMLVKLCDYYHMKPLFVISPLNVYAYTDLEKINPVMAEADKTIRNSGFQLLNLWTTDKNHYQKGILSDVMHIGEYGWYVIDSAIYNQYCISK